MHKPFRISARGSYDRDWFDSDNNVRRFELVITGICWKNCWVEFNNNILKDKWMKSPQR